MTEALWTSVDRYFAGLFIGADPALDAAMASISEAGLPPISVSPNQGKLLHLMARMCGARKILEIGTLGGYSTIWLARTLSIGGKLVTLEAMPKHADIARSNFVRAGLSNMIDLRLGPALETLPKLHAEGAGPFDFVFIDADKPSNPDYFAWALKLSRPGSVIVIDNVVRDGRVTDASSTAADVQGIRRMNEMIAKEPRVSATAMQVVGSKGYDGLAVVRVNDELPRRA